MNPHPQLQPEPCRQASVSDPRNTLAATVPSASLLGLQGTLRIDHRGAIYTLRSTSKGGLILTK